MARQFVSGSAAVLPFHRRSNGMNIHEYQAKEILKQYGVAVPDGIPAFSVDEAVAAAQKLAESGASLFIVKPVNLTSV